MVPSILRSMNCPVYGFAWLPAQGRTCAVYGQTHVKTGTVRGTIFACQYGTKYGKFLLIRVVFLLSVSLNTLPINTRK